MRVLITLFIVAIALTSCGKEVLGEALQPTNGDLSITDTHINRHAESARIGLHYFDASIRLDAKNYQSSPVWPGKIKIWGTGIASINGKDIEVEMKMLFNSDGKLLSGGIILNPYDGQVSFVFDRGQGSLPYIFKSMSATMTSYYEVANPALVSRISVVKFKEWDNLDK